MSAIAAAKREVGPRRADPIAFPAVTGFLEETFGLTGRVAVVTGGSSGIGRGIATALARAGASVVLIARGAPALRETVTALESAGGRAAHVIADLGERTEVRRAAEDAARIFGEPDILVNCAGINLRPPMDELDASVWDRSMAVNLDAPFLLGQRFGPGMAERGHGRIINVASQQSFRAFGNSGAYGAGKGGLVALTRSQAEAWSPRGVCCNALVPGFVVTPLTTHIPPERHAAMADRTLIGRNGRPDDFAGAAVFLASAASAYVTGQSIFVDGGFSAH
ncbi:SDR family NAD(P)-dependent oxidoreductase [Actinoallomurus iriomotensis]|uniref:2-deoxy-D-gluconate 3-dehydrogenase n=1 Tax=Actinoallomurus iriomotensis TaxID=478107 RepID=A0A9W6RLC7_9ACTN|nr:SDR family oxidoreductase [Actinoallomurus iriomotensis]GLY76127.1 2-deoxy-D-gluconate 3-dehydrogenase [Actinoallomurus iriomotensis]